MLEKGGVIYWVIIVAFFMPLLLSVILTWGFRRFQRNKHQSELEKRDLLLRQQELIIDKQKAIELERSRIASEMHDDIGSGLTTIKYLSDRAISHVQNPDDRRQIEKIASQSSDLVRSMSEIIWAMNSRFDTLDSLLAYIRHYASGYLDEYNIELGWTQSDDLLQVCSLNGVTRRNVFLAFKECLHNVVKHAHASKVTVLAQSSDNGVRICIHDNGQGFDPELVRSHGNGIYNMQKRMEQIGGEASFSTSKEGTQVSLIFKPDDMTSIVPHA